MHKYNYSMLVSEDGKEFFKVYGRENCKELAKEKCLRKADNFKYKNIKSFQEEKY